MVQPAHPHDSGQPDLSGIPGPGEVVAGKLQVERVIGVGGMGAVVAARHVQLGQRVAIKFLLPEAARHPEAMARFLREATAASAITSEHVARVIDVGSLPSGAPFMVMEFLAGRDLAQLLRMVGARPVAEAVDYVLQAGEAVAQAHALGIVHRDLKPSNLFLTQRSDGAPLVKVLDFGISKVVSDGPQANLTATSFSFGTPTYMSPEQIRSAKKVDPRTDVWALGVILYELLSNRTPFEAETVPGLCAAISMDAPAPLVAPGIPAELAAVVLRCLEKDLSRRYQNMGELAVALAPFASPFGRSLVPRIEAIARSGSPAAMPELGQAAYDGRGTAGTWEGGRPGPMSGRKLVAATAAATLCAGLLAALLVSKLASPSHPALSAETPGSALPVAQASSPPPSPSESAPPAVSPVDPGSVSPTASASASPSASSKTARPPTKRGGGRKVDDALGERR